MKICNFKKDMQKHCVLSLKRQRKKLKAQYQNTENVHEKTVIIKRNTYQIK